MFMQFMSFYAIFMQYVVNNKNRCKTNLNETDFKIYLKLFRLKLK